MILFFTEIKLKMQSRKYENDEVGRTNIYKMKAGKLTKDSTRSARGKIIYFSRRLLMFTVQKMPHVHPVSRLFFC